MLNTTKRITTPTRIALLALGAISLSAAMASPASAQNASTCRSSIGVAGDFAERCLVKPEGNLGTAILSSVGKVNAAAQGDSNYSHDLSKSLNDAEVDRITDTNDGPSVAHYDKNGQITSVDYPTLGFSEKSIPDGILRVYPNGRQELVYLGTEQGLGGGSGGAAGHTAARRTLTTPDRGAQTAAAPPKAVPTPIKTTTFDKATNTTTRDHRTGATASAGGPPPAAAIGSSSKPSAGQLAAQSGDRDHRRK
jgi:hypothetical protein